MLRKLCAGTAIAILAMSTAAVANDEIRSGGRVNLILHESHKPITAQAGLTYLDPLRHFNCRSANGCVVTIHGVLEYQNYGGPSLCSFIDGNPTLPACGYNDGYGPSGEVPFTGSARVTQGIHTFQSAAKEAGGGGTIADWEVEYAIYEIKPFD
jgi:hypothetical protein